MPIGRDLCKTAICGAFEALCAARSLAYLLDMSALAALLRLELHPHLGVLQRSLGVFGLRIMALKLLNLNVVCELLNSVYSCRAGCCWSAAH